MTLQDLIDYAYEKGFDPSECVIKAETYNDGHLYDVYHDDDEVFEPMIVLGFYPDETGKNPCDTCDCGECYDCGECPGC